MTRRTIGTWLPILAALGLLAACNTVAGVGEDITGVARAAQGGVSAGLSGDQF